MAPPSATETLTQRPAAEQHVHRLNLGQYKQVEAVEVDHDTETGKNGAPAAKVCNIDTPNH